MKTAAVDVIKKLAEAGHQALLAGGCVRDHLLGKAAKDYDVATSARPEEVVRIFRGAKTVGAHFGVVIVRQADETIEVATFRRDGVYSDGRRPDSVAFTTAEEDAQRRDFTVNGLFYDPLKDEVIDFVGGRDDLRRKVIRAIGDPRRRFAEDHLRLLRAVRFATVLDFEIEPTTWSAMRELAPCIASVSAERVRDEFIKTLEHPRRVAGFDLLVGSGLMGVILPEIMALQGCEQPPQFHPEGDVFVHTRLMLGLLPADASLPLILAVLFHDIAKPPTFTVDETGRIRFNGHDKLGAEMTGDILRRLKFPNHVVAPVVEAVANHMAFINVPKMRTARLKRFMARPGFEDEMELHRADCLGSAGDLSTYEFVRRKQHEFASEPLIPPRLLTGADLIQLGWKAGPALGSVLTAIQNLQLEGALHTREDALRWIEVNAPVPDQFAEETGAV
ncbi:MAG: CCA tRNA nucleotidyltransferase [Verrucomicrobiaceae bacterium]|nr:CCA tRNA nucleotidyltransferase [Verrucomicrobiaceae bacterium]